MKYTDDMGFTALVDLASRLLRKSLQRSDFLIIILGLNVGFLYFFLFTLREVPSVQLMSAWLILLPQFYIPRNILGPDLFSLYGSMSLAGLGIVMAIFQGNRRRLWILSGVVLMGIYFLRQALGLILGMTLLLTLVILLRHSPHRKLHWLKRLGWSCLGGGLLWLIFHTTLMWRDHQLHLTHNEKRTSKHHTIFHPLYVGIGNMKSNPWGIVYSDQFASDQILGKGQFDRVHPYSEDYLKEVRYLYLSIWRKDGGLLFWLYFKHFLFVIHQTLGYFAFALGLGYTSVTLFFYARTPRILTPVEILMVTSSILVMGFLTQSTLIDFRALYSYPTALVGKLLLGFSILHAWQRWGWRWLISNRKSEQPVESRQASASSPH
jgi:hypothetical protein